MHRPTAPSLLPCARATTWRGLRFLAGVAALSLLSLPALAQGKGLEEPSRADYYKTLNGKTVAFVAGAMVIDLTQGWYGGIRRELEPLGVKFVLRDANFSADAGAQAITNLIGEKPDIIIVHNLDVTTNARLLQRAEAAGIYVLQINMRSTYSSAGYIGPDWVDMGEKQAEAVVASCKGKSNKIAIVQGAISAAASAYTLKGVENVLAKHPEVKVVSSQPADWDVAKAKALTQTVLKSNPDLCGIVGFWDGMDIGTAAAIKESNLTGKVFLSTSGGGAQKSACDMVKAGSFDHYMNYNVEAQITTMSTMIKWLLQSGVKPGTSKGAIFSQLTPITKDPATQRCWTLEAVK
ncbi:MAG TPA: sugar ABC transporter substrate-binding protein [Burkholderiaceae bacterium]|nr:sugar ABC transporter substrate-binding protein [Burkholderiaceae bacterium]